jgi:hypothetical protein
MGIHRRRIWTPTPMSVVLVITRNRTGPCQSLQPLRHRLAERSGVARAMIHKNERGESSRAAVQEAKLDEAVELTDTYCAIAGVAQRFTRLSQIFPRWVRLRPLTVAFALCRAAHLPPAPSTPPRRPTTIAVLVEPVWRSRVTASAAEIQAPVCAVLRPAGLSGYHSL